VELPVRLPDLSSPLVLWILAAACAIVAILALAWILTRGRGRSGSALRTAEVDIDTRVVTQLLQDSLAGTPDVLSVDASAFVRRRARLVRITVQTRRHPDLVVLRDRIRSRAHHHRRAHRPRGRAHHPLTPSPLGDEKNPC
jgi:hypothetical protein